MVNTFAPQACPGGEDLKSHFKCHISQEERGRKEEKYKKEKEKTHL